MTDHQSNSIDFKRIFEFSPGLFLLLKPNFDIVAVSNTYLQATLTKREDIVGKNIFTVFPDNPNDSSATGTTNLRSSLERVVRTKSADTMAVQKYDIPRPESTGGGFDVKYWSPFNSPVLNETGDVSYIIHRVEDVTSFMLLKEQGIAQEKQLELELFQRAQELQNTNQKLRSAEKLKSEFLATMSHEIRTPMNGIMGMTDLILMTNLDVDQRTYAKVIQDSCTNLLNIINDILDFSKIEAGRMDLEIINFSIVQTVENQSDLLATRYKPKGLSFTTYIDPKIPTYLKGDPGRIGQVLLNLIDNAIKFTSTGSIFVEAKLLSQPMPYQNRGPFNIQFSVTDTGIGIPKESISQLFEPFMQADRSTTRRFGGTGLGLSISKKLVQLMGGNIGVESVEGHGSCFWFTLPLVQGDLNLDETLRPRADLNSFKILVADTDRISRNVLHQYITSWGATNSEATSSSRCLEILNREAETGVPYNLVLINLGTEAITTALKIFSHPHLSNTKLIMITGYDQAVSDQEIRQHGFSGRITKPFKQSQIFDCIISALSDSHSGQIEAKASLRPTTRDEIKGRVLIVEDNLVNQMVAKALLESLGYAVLMAANGQDAIQQIGISDYDLILMDCQMPVMDGFETTRAIRAMNHPAKCKVPIVALTANAMKVDEEMCLKVGMNDYLSKPIRRESLERKLRQWIKPT